MIEKMYRLSLLVKKEGKDRLLDKLQDLGVVDVIKKKDVHFSEQLQEIKNIRQLTNYLANLNQEIKATEGSKASFSEVKNFKAAEILPFFNQHMEEIKRIEQEEQLTKKELHNISPWGDFDLSLIKQLHSKLFIKFISLPKKGLNKLLDQAEKLSVYVEIISLQSGYYYVVAISPNDFNLEGQIHLLSKDRRQLARELDQLHQQREAALRHIYSLKQYIPLLQERERELINRVHYLEVDANLNSDDYFYSLEGWLAEGDREKVEQFLQQEKDLAYLISEVEEEVDIPVKLKNSSIFKYFEPITKLFDLPNYYELDLTPLFAPSFVCFFAICFGDAGYGIVLLMISLILFYGKKFSKIRAFAIIGILFSIMTIILGSLMGTIFGVSVFDHPIPILKDIAIFPSEHMFYISLLIGLFQILFGLTVQIFNRWTSTKKWSSTISPLGWIFLFAGLSILYLRGEEAPANFLLGSKIIDLCRALPLSLNKAMIAIALLGIIFFSSEDRNVAKRVGSGLWALYGITGKCGDLLSFIRLFALGLSSGILGLVINDISYKMMASHWLGIVPAILILLIGHAINFSLSIIGSFAHPLRLTFVEFYNSAGFSGGGREFKAFKKK